VHDIARTRREIVMGRYLLIQNYEGGVCTAPMGTWDPADVRAHIEFQQELNAELAASGELVDAQGVAAPEQAKRVTSDGAGAPVIRTGPFPESSPLLAGYRIVDVDSEERALEIAARTSAAPGPAGVPLQQPIEVRQVMVAP
jgi:hypothetical protein